MAGPICSYGGKISLRPHRKPIEIRILSTPSKAFQEDCTLKCRHVCKGTTSTPQSDRRSRTKAGRETGSKLDHFMSKEMCRQFVPSQTELSMKLEKKNETMCCQQERRSEPRRKG